MLKAILIALAQYMAERSMAKSERLLARSNDVMDRVLWWRAVDEWAEGRFQERLEAVVDRQKKRRLDLP